MISTDFDGGSSDFQRYSLEKIGENRYKSEAIPVKIGRDHRDIRDIGLRDLFFRDLRVPKRFCIG